MLVRTIRKLLTAGCVAGLFLFWGQASQSDVIFEIHADTSALTGTIGSLDFQFNPGPGAPAATATIYGFSSDGTLGAVTTTTPPYATGNLSGSLKFTNGEPGDNSSVNEVKQSFTIGSFFDIFVDLNIPIPGPSDNTTTFGMAIYDETGTPVQPIFGDFAVVLQPNSDGTYTSISGGPTVTALPEPSTLTLAAVGLAGLAGASWRRRRTRHVPVQI